MLPEDLFLQLQVLAGVQDGDKLSVSAEDKVTVVPGHAGALAHLFRVARRDGAAPTVQALCKLAIALCAHVARAGPDVKDAAAWAQACDKAAGGLRTLARTYRNERNGAAAVQIDDIVVVVRDVASRLNPPKVVRPANPDGDGDGDGAVRDIPAACPSKPSRGPYYEAVVSGERISGPK